MKKLQNNFTTPEQSKKLLELGVPAWTADCFRWDFSSAFGISEDKRYSTSISVICYEYQRDFHDKLPCWSVGRLMEIAKICSKSRYALRGLFLFLEDCEADECMSQVMDYFEICNYQFDFSRLEE